MNKQRQLYWLVHQSPTAYEKQVGLLNAMDIQVSFFLTLDQLRIGLKKRRAAIIMISDNSAPETLRKQIVELTALPEANGVRFFLILEKFQPQIMELAAASNFRDLIPLNLEADQWTYRILFSSAGKPVKYYIPDTQVTMNSISAVNMPGRLVWINGTRLRIESSVSMNKGANFHLTGPIAQALGVPNISVTVESNQKSQLSYRFSEAIIGTWKASEATAEKLRAMISKQKESGSGLLYRTYVIAKGNELRHQVMAKLRHDSFEVRYALQLQAITLEPQFYSPDLIIVEDQICRGPTAERFAEMLRIIDPKIPILIVGQNADMESLRNSYRNDNIMFCGVLPENLHEILLSEFNTIPSSSDDNRDSLYLRPNALNSFVKLGFPARLVQIHPTVVQLALPYAVGRFALMQLASPFLHKTTGINPWVKTVAVYLNSGPEGTPFPFVTDAFLVDVDATQKEKIAELLTKHVTDYLKQAARGLRVAIDNQDEAEAQKEIETVTQLATTSQLAPKPEVRETQRLISNQIDKYAAAADGLTLNDIVASLRENMGTKTARQFYIVAACLLAFALLLYTLFVVEPVESDKSGQWFGDQLYKFAPQQFEKSLDNKR